MTSDLINDLEILPIPSRKLTLKTADRFGYAMGKDHKGRACHVSPYYRDGKLVAQHLRYPGKNFRIVGDTKELPFFGQRHCSGSGRRIVVTEGQLDAMSVDQVLGNKWPVVSVPHGTGSATKCVKNNIAFLEGYDEVVFMFDMDEPGQEAALECARLLSPGKAKIASLPLKDASECLLNGDAKAINSAVWEAQPYRPDGLVKVSDIKDEALKPLQMGLPWPWESLTKATYGRHRGQVITLGAGTGIGKSDVFTQIIAHTIADKADGGLELPAAVFYLEQMPKETVRRIAGKTKGRPFHVPLEEGEWDQSEYEETINKLDADNRLTFYDHFGETDWGVIEGHIRYLYHSEGVLDFFIDHLTAMADPDNEKESLEVLMKSVATLAQELGITVYMISHLTTPEKGKSHEEGGRVTIRQFKGSRSIGFWSHVMIGLERDQQSESEDLKNITTMRVLKERYTGRGTGALVYLRYEHTTGMLHETDKPESTDGFKDQTIPAHGESDF